ncbi:MAG: glycosyl hydrolase, partial [Actinomycetota bacterium]|nr:glycosyl hydrolase [Actinomycetota bacterium]
MKPKVEEENVIYDIYKNFIDIKNEYRPVNFWGWNDLINKDKVKKQVGYFKEAGAGGFFIHARSGLKTAYLSDEWIKNVKIATQEAKKFGIKCWLYDEYNFPSGYAGGKVPALGEKYWQKALTFSVSKRKEEFADLISAYSMTRGKVSVNLIVNPIFADRNNYIFKKIPEADIKQEINNGNDIVYLFVEKAKTGSKYFNGYCYVDILNKKTVDAFLRYTHEKYYNNFKNEFGETIPGIFTDEPSILYYPDFPENSLPWSDDLLSLFEKRNGYKLEDNLIYLFFNIKGYEKIRFDYWRLISDMFLNNYTKNIYSWCKNHSLLFTGHFMYEEDLVEQVKWSGSVMPHYEYMDIPAVDKLFRTIENPITIKQVSSVANQLGKNRIGSEVFGASGQSLSFEDMKWIADWQAALGINMLIPHISMYSIYGSRKKDYPPNIFFQQPWWKYTDYIFDYFSRLSYVLSLGQYDTKILVINPISSIWASYSPIEEKFSKEINGYFELLIKELLENQICFDLGDEEIMLRHSEIKKDKLIIGKSEYNTVIIPPSINIYGSTLDIISNFLKNGGKLISVKPLPYMVNGIANKKVEDVLVNGVVLDLFGKLKKGNYYKKFDNNLLDFLGFDSENHFNITDKSGNSISDIYLHQRSCKGFKIFFLTNISRNKKYESNISMPGDGDIEI